MDALVEPLKTGMRRCLKKAKPLLEKLEEFRTKDLFNEEEAEKEVAKIQRRVLPALAKKDPISFGAWQALERFSLLALTIYSKDKKARAAVGEELKSGVADFSPWFPNLSELHEVFQILEGEKLLVIDVDNFKGFVGSFGGVVDNVQLLILIMDTLPKMEVFPKEFVSRYLALSAKGQGPKSVGQTFDGLWNHYTYRALKGSGKLPDANDLTANKEWIWLESRPSEIPSLDGYRVILLGPPSYERSWGFERRFELVEAGIEVESELSRADYDFWMDKILQANQAK